MKKIVSILIAVICIFGVVSLCGCGDDKTDGNKDSAGTQGVQLGEGSDAINVDEATIKSLLAAYPQSALGLQNEIYDYDLKLTADEFRGKSAVKIEAYLEKAENPEATLLFLGTEFYIYDSAKEKYLKLTVTGPVDEVDTEQATPETSVLTDEEVEEDNNNVLQNRYKKYDLSVVKLEKDISEYELLVTGTPATATDKNQVYVIKVIEKTGEDTGIRFAVGESGDYYFNTEKNAYVKLK